MPRRRRERPLVYILVGIALIVFVVGVIYLSMTPKDLPSFLPGHVAARGAARAAKSTARYSKRATMAFVASAAIFLVAVSQSWTWRRWRHYR
jgi:hypothetical protein